MRISTLLINIVQQMQHTNELKYPPEPIAKFSIHKISQQAMVKPVNSNHCTVITPY